MKKIFLLSLLIIGSATGLYWRGQADEPAKPADEKAPAEEQRISHDDEGRVVIKLDAKVQAKIGLVAAQPEAARLSPEVKGFGRVLDTASVAGLLVDLSSAQAAYTVTSRELDRLKTLATQGNASDRALQMAEAAAAHDKIALQAAQDRLRLAWGELADRKDLPELMDSFAARKLSLVRIDLSAGQSLDAPTGARIFNLAGKMGEAEFIGLAPNVDPQFLGRGYLFLVKQSGLSLVPGEAVTGYLKASGDALSGVNILSSSVIRTEGAGWVYVLNSAGEQFTRVKVALDHPIATGWFVTTEVTTNDSVVTSGAQILLSEELKSSLKPD